MTEGERQKFESGYNEGYWMGIGDAMKMALEVIKTASSNHILDSSKTYLTATLELKVKSALQKKKLLPYSYDVITGKAEDVPAPWE